MIALDTMGKHDLLEFFQKGCSEFGAGPGSSKTQHDRKHQGTHNRHDLRNGKFENHIRQSFQLGQQWS